MPRTIRALRYNATDLQELAHRSAPPHAPEQPGPRRGLHDPDNLIVYGGLGRRPHATGPSPRPSCARWKPGTGRDAVGAVGQAGGCLPHARGRRGCCWPTPTSSPPGRRRRPTSRTWERDGLIMYGQMTAGSWIYIGTQGIFQGTYETFGRRPASTAGRHRPAGKVWFVTAGLGGWAGPAAGRHHERRRRPACRGGPLARSAASTCARSTASATISTRP